MPSRLLRRPAPTLITLVLCVSALAVDSKHVTITDYLGLDWPGELVHYELTFGKGEWTGPANVSVRPAGGNAIPCQVSDVVRDPQDGSITQARVWFFADVPAVGTATYEVLPGAAPAKSAGVVVRESEDAVELLTPAPKPVGIRMPKLSKRCDWPVPAQDVPGPIQALVLPSGKLVGRGRFDVPFRVKACDVRITASGPLFAEAVATYLFDVGTWTFRARVIRGEPVVLIDEEFDTGVNDEPGDTFDRFYTLPLNSADFAPTQVFYGANNYDDAFSGLLKAAVPDADLAKAAGVRNNWFASLVNGYELAFAEDRLDYSLTGYPTAQQRVGGIIRYVQPGGDAVGFVGLDTAAWVNPLAVRCSVTASGEARVQLPLQRYRQKWFIDGLDPKSPNYTGTVRFAPDGTVRRRYGIVLTSAENETDAKLTSLFAVNAKLSAMPLDHVKDFTLDWTDPMANATWTWTSAWSHLSSSSLRQASTVTSNSPTCASPASIRSTIPTANVGRNSSSCGFRNRRARATWSCSTPG